MKNLKESKIILAAIFITAILLLLDFTSCEKIETPELIKEKIKIGLEIRYYAMVKENVNLNVTIGFNNSSSTETRNFDSRLQYDSQAYYKEIYVYPNELINLSISHNELKGTRFYLVASNGKIKKAFIFTDKCSVLADNEFIDIK